ncbi:MAG: hypothetical protein RLZZ172_1765 [Bacteroidota bacterium]|jgi:hypothetical protein
MEEIRNKVAESGLITLDPEKYYPVKEPLTFDLKDFLFREMLLREKDFRESIEQHNWSQYQDAHVAVFCSSEAIIPLWAYMLVSSKLMGIAGKITVGSVGEAIKSDFLERIRNIDRQAFADKRVIIKGCGEKEIQPYVYEAFASHLLPVVKSLMYGEPCSTVPIYKRK